MYEAQFLLKRRPFAATPDPRCFLAAGQIQSALDELVICVEQGQGVSVVSAPAGTGKTLLCERLRTELESRFQVVLLPHASFLTRRALLQSILADLNHSYRRQDEQELRLELSPAIRALSPKREAMALILDEAHMLGEDLLEELRILSDLSDHGRPLVRLVLVGQPGLEETLALPGLEALNQRIRAHVCLDSFDRTGTLDYIDYRITWAGGRTSEIFTPEALELIYRASEGVPRCINQLCDHALLLAYVAEQKPVTAETIREALKDLRQLPLHWNESLLADSTNARVTVETSMTDELETNNGSSGNLQAYEFGADLPLDNSSLESPAEINRFEHEPDDLQTEKMTNQDHKPGITNTMATIPNKETRQKSQATPASAPKRIETLPPGLIMEEVVSDRYAAIDGGFPMPVVVKQADTETTDGRDVAAFDCDTGFHKTVHNFVPKSHLESEDTTDETAAEFEEACSRLDDLLPEIHENPGWDTSSLVRAFKTPRSNPVSESDEWESLEEELGISVCELAGDIKAELKSSDLPVVEQLQHMLGTAQAETIEVGAPEPSGQSTGTPEPAERPYRNLFSRLRRKQQGLL